MTSYRHGDLIIRQVERPEGTTRHVVEYVAAEGEITGHRHVVRGEIAVFEDMEAQNRQVVEFLSAVEIDHEDHGPMRIEPGVYEITRQQEKDWLLDSVRRVSD